MALNWAKWGRDFVFSVMRHIGTAGMTWTGLSFQDGKLDATDLHSLWIAILSGAILPTLFTALQSPPTEETTVITETKTQTVTSTHPVAATTPAPAAPQETPTETDPPTTTPPTTPPPTNV